MEPTKKQIKSMRDILKENLVTKSKKKKVKKQEKKLARNYQHKIFPDKAIHNVK